jgi:NAD(P)-dependent dehydrogenase (short-subunit alcohol dehydrogenase family)
VLVNNAGITRDTTFKKMSKVDWDAVMRTNLDSLFNMTKQVADGMVQRGWGRIINISSVNGSKGAVRPDQLLGREGWCARLHQGAGARSREEERHR